MKLFVCILLAILFTSCASKQPSEREIPNLIDKLVAEGKFPEARQMASKLTFHKDLHKIDNSEKCLPVINQCEAVNLTQNDIRKCQFEIETSCFGHNNSSYNYTRSISNRLDKLKISLANKAEEVNESNTKSEMKMCESDSRWSYKKEKSCSQCAQNIKESQQNLVGSFLTRGECEEARIKEDKIFDTGRSCVENYVGKSKYKNNYELLAMSNYKKLTITFNSLEDCEIAFKNGYDYYDSNLNKHSLKEYGSKEESRFIGKCTLIKKLICSSLK